MKINTAALILLCLAMTSVPAMAQIYDNGPVNGQVDAWTLNFGYAVSDTFHISGGATVSNISFWAWVEPGDTATSVEVAMGSTGYFSNNLFDGTVSLSQSSCFTNNFGLDVCQEYGFFNGPALGQGNYYLTLENAATVDGNPMYWDENSGVGCQSNDCPSSAEESTFGTIPSEAFTLGGACGVGQNSPDCGPPSPEPGSFLLFGSGIVSLAAVWRLKIRR